MSERCEDLISREKAIYAVADYIHNVDRVFGTGLLSDDDCKDAAASVLENLPSEQSEVTEEDVREWCYKRCLTIIDNALYLEMRSRWLPSAQPEPVCINLNEPIKVKLTDLGKEIYYHQYDRTNQIAGREVCKPNFPKEDEDGYTEFQLWHFIELYGMHIGMTLPNVIEPLEIVYER